MRALGFLVVEVETGRPCRLIVWSSPGKLVALGWSGRRVRARPASELVRCDAPALEDKGGRLRRWGAGCRRPTLFPTRGRALAAIDRTRWGRARRDLPALVLAVVPVVPPD